MTSGLTDEERKMLIDLHRALMEVPPGAAKDARPLIADMRAVIDAHRRASWATRAFVWVIPTAAGLGLAVERILGWLR